MLNKGGRIIDSSLHKEKNIGIIILGQEIYIGLLVVSQIKAQMGYGVSHHAGNSYSCMNFRSSNYHLKPTNNISTRT